MSEKNTFYFDNVHTVAAYLCSLKAEISPVKLHKSLYFLFAYFGATYQEQQGFEGTNIKTKYLYPATIEAWKFGPVIREVYDKQTYNEEEIEIAKEEISKHEEVKKFIDEIFKQIDACSDFTLVDRSHIDKSWKNAYSPTEINNIEYDVLIQEYVDNYI